MRLISTVFIICLFGKLINCNNNNDQSKSSPSDKPAVAAASASNQASNQASAQPAADSLKLESRQIPALAASPHQYVDRSDGSVQHVAINTHNLSPKESAYHNANPNAPVGYIQIQPVLAPLSAHHTPEQQGSTSFISFIKPQQAGGRRSFSLTNKLKNFMSSLFWKDTSSSTPYMASGSSYSFAFKQPPPFNFVAQNQAPNYAAASQYKPVVFGNYPQASSNSLTYNKYAGSFNGQQYGNAAAASAPTGYSAMPASYYQSSGQTNGGYGSNGNSNSMNGASSYQNQAPNYMQRNNGMHGSNGMHSNTGFPPSSYQVFPGQYNDAQASGSNTVNTYAAANQFANSNGQPAADSNASAAYGGDFNQRLSASETRKAANLYPNADSSSSSSAASNALPLTGNQAANPVSLLKTGKQFGSY